MEGEEEPKVEVAPEGSSCAEHPERPALVTCPRCGNFCCVACWHGAVKRCHTCLVHDPLPPVPWADGEKSLPSRFFGTLGDAIRPRASSAAFAHGDWKKGITFALLTVLPLALLSGVIPFTRRLAFGDSWSVVPLGAPNGTELALDIAQAVGMGTLRVTLELLLIAAAYLLLLRMYSKEKLDSRPGLQVLLYRGWLVAMGGRFGVVLALASWGLAADQAPSPSLFIAFELMTLFPILLLMMAMISTARVGGAGPMASIIMTMVAAMLPIYLEQFVAPLVLPDSAEVQAAVEGAP